MPPLNAIQGWMRPLALPVRRARDLRRPLAPLLPVWPGAPCRNRRRSSGQTPTQSQASWQWQRLSFFACRMPLGTVRPDGAEFEINKLDH
jgi:hypothetical protein